MIPFSKVFKKFNNNLTDKEIAKLVDDKRKAFLENSISVFVQQSGIKVTADFDNEIITEDLKDTDMYILAQLMYDKYLNQEITLKNALIAISTDAFKIGNTDKKVEVLKEQQRQNMNEINNMFSSYL